MVSCVNILHVDGYQLNTLYFFLSTRMEDGELLGGLTEMLKGGRSSEGNDVIFRPGTKSDILPPDNDDDTKYWEAATDGNTRYLRANPIKEIRP